MKTKILSTEEFQAHLTNSKINVTYFQTNAGKLKVSYTQLGIFKSEFEDNDQIENFENCDFINEKLLILVGTEFQIKVWKETLKIAKGTLSSYSEIAIEIEHPKAHRAVANALANNNIAYFIPCHRVSAKNQKLCGYKWGIEKKIALIDSEKI